jgi:EAL domain-containing protein (putative c-di-GMP-specific phosphodiesterase class I)
MNRCCGVARGPFGEAVENNKVMQQLLAKPGTAATNTWRRRPARWDSALAQQTVVAVFQPKAELRSGKIVGVEALARTVDPVKGLVSAAKFFEDGSDERLRQLTISMLEQALAAQQAWRGLGHDLTISVNVPASLLEQWSVCANLLETVVEFGGDPQRVTLEVVETGKPANDFDFLNSTAKLRDAGFGLAIDDFGVGYSSLLALLKVPFTELKIDRAFVHGAAGNSRVRAALEACATLGGRFGLMVTAEGVEDAADLSPVLNSGCNLVQGFAIARPMQANDIPNFISSDACALSSGLTVASACVSNQLGIIS